MKTKENTFVVQINDPNDPETIKSSKISKKYEPILEKMNREGDTSINYRKNINDFFPNGIDGSTRISLPIYIDYPTEIHIGKNVFINRNLTCVSRGGIFIEDGVMIAPNVQLLSVNHDLVDHFKLYASSIYIRKNAWIGAGSIILPGVEIGENAVIAAGSVVTKDVLKNTLVGGNPAHLLKNILPNE